MKADELASWLYANSTGGKSEWNDALPGGLLPGCVALDMGDRVRASEIFSNVAYGELFPVKKIDGAWTKQNIFIKDVMRGLKKKAPHYYNEIVGKLVCCVGLTADQVVCLVMYHKLLWDSGYYCDIRTLRYFIHNRDLCKAVSDLVKNIGVAINPYLARWTELDCLLGRGSVPADGERELREMRDGGVEGHDVQFEPGVIYKESIKVLHECLSRCMVIPEDTRWDTIAMGEEAYWNGRTQHCVNGAHHMPAGINDPTKTRHGIKTRMVYLEMETKSPLFVTRPMIDATLSWKMESPKVRAIKSADTVSYLNEDYVMKAVEKMWDSKHVLLDPGCASRAEAGDRIDNMEGKYYCMLDFSAMDKQHSIQSQVELITALCDVMCMPDHIRKWLIESNSEQYVTYGQTRIKSSYSLLSGRRMTTFINTVLNRVYLNIALGEMMPLSSYHAGDDVVMRVDSLTSMRRIAKLAMGSRNVFNPRKQSLGLGAEFLRVATYKNLSISYVARSIASTVCGSWVNKLLLAEAHLPGLYSRYSWMLDNRGMIGGYSAPLLFHSMHARTGMPLNICWRICTHKICVDSSPVVTSDDCVTIMRPRVRIETKNVTDLPREGSKVVVAELERKLNMRAVTKAEKTRLVNILSLASNMKSVIDHYSSGEFTFERAEATPGVYSNTPKLRKLAWKGVLSKHPSLPTVQTLLTEATLRTLAEFTTGLSKPQWMSNREWLSGNKTYGVISNYANDYDCLLYTSPSPRDS